LGDQLVSLRVERLGAKIPGRTVRRIQLERAIGKQFRRTPVVCQLPVTPFHVHIAEREPAGRPIVELQRILQKLDAALVLAFSA
jgi:hypothetical protein